MRYLKTKQNKNNVLFAETFFTNICSICVVDMKNQNSADDDDSDDKEQQR